jgi:hypothetical protein
VFAGMILASFVGIFAIPPLYVSFQWMREKLSRKAAVAKPGQGQEAKQDRREPAAVSH